MALAAIAATASAELNWAALLDPSAGVTGQILKIILIDLILSGDNAVLIALACRGLPRRHRRAGIILGAAVAIVLRIVFAGAVTQLLAIPYLRMIGGLLLLWIAIKLLLGEDEEEPDIAAHDRLWRAVYTIAIADALMSLDNVIAVAAVAKGSVALIAFGIALSVPLIIWGSTLVLALLDRFPVVVWLGAALLGWIAGELIASEIALQSTYAGIANTCGLSTKLLHHGIALFGIVVTLAGAWLWAKWARRGVSAES